MLYFFKLRLVLQAFGSILVESIEEKCLVHRLRQTTYFLALHLRIRLESVVDANLLIKLGVGRISADGLGEPFEKEGVCHHLILLRGLSQHACSWALRFLKGGLALVVQYIC